MTYYLERGLTSIKWFAYIFLITAMNKVN